MKPQATSALGSGWLGLSRRRWIGVAIGLVSLLVCSYFTIKFIQFKRFFSRFAIVSREQILAESRWMRRFESKSTNRLMLEREIGRWALATENRALDANVFGEVHRWVCESKAPTLDRIVVGKGFGNRFHLTGERTPNG